MSEEMGIRKWTLAWLAFKELRGVFDRKRLTNPS